MLYLKRILKAIVAGVLIGIAGVAFLIAKDNSSNAFLPSLVFPIGLFLICTFGYDLYTGKIGYLFKKDNEYKLLDLLLMLVFNLLGAFLVGFFYYLSIKDSKMYDNAIAICESKFLSISFVNEILIFFKAFLCGMCVFIAVDLFKKFNSEVAKIFAVWIPIFLFVFLGLDHSIANMFYMSAGNCYNINSIVALLVAIIGNSCGSIVLYFINQFIK